MKLLETDELRGGGLLLLMFLKVCLCVEFQGFIYHFIPILFHHRLLLPKTIQVFNYYLFFVIKIMVTIFQLFICFLSI